MIPFPYVVKRKCDFDEFCDIGYIGSGQIDNYRCDQWRKFRQNDNIPASVHFNVFTWTISTQSNYVVKFRCVLLPGQGQINFTSLPQLTSHHSHDDVIKWKHLRVTGPLSGEPTGHRWIPHKGQWRGTLTFSLICTWTNGWVNNRDAGDLRRHRAPYDITVTKTSSSATSADKVGIMTNPAFQGRQFLISQSAKAMRLDVKITAPLWNLAGASAALFPRYLPNFGTIGQHLSYISRLQDFVGLGIDTSYVLMNSGPGAKYIRSQESCMQLNKSYCHGLVRQRNQHYSDVIMMAMASQITSLTIVFRRRSKKASKLRDTGLCKGNPPVTGGFPSQRASNAGNVSNRLCHHGGWWVVESLFADYSIGDISDFEKVVTSPSYMTTPGAASNDKVGIMINNSWGSFRNCRQGQHILTRCGDVTRTRGWHCVNWRKVDIWIQ